MARYEASQFGAGYIEPEHLLLALFREDKLLQILISIPAIQNIRKEVEERYPRGEKIALSVDLPLSHSSKRALAFAAEEAKMLNNKFIDSGHLVLALLRDDTRFVAELLQRHNITLESYRRGVNSFPPALLGDRSEPSLKCEPASTSLRDPIAAYEALVESTTNHFNDYDDVDWCRRLKRRTWTRKQAVGHLIDWATTHHQWFARALTSPKLAAAGYPEDEWVEAQQYDFWPVHELNQTWRNVASLVSRVMYQIPEDKLETPCKIGIQEPIPLRKLVLDYIEHCRDLTGQILTLGDHA